MTATEQTPGVYRRKISDILVTAVLDGVLNGNFGLVTGIDAGEAERTLTERFRPGPPILAVNCFVVETAGKTVMIDSGAGANDMFDAGRLPMALNAAGISPDAVDLVLLSHLHPDHAGGLASGDRAMFPNAELMLHADEAKFWFDTPNPPEGMAPYFEMAKAATKPYAARTRTFIGGEVAPGIEVEFLPGHTPGHCGFVVGSGKDTMLMWTDIVHIPALQARHPEAGIAFDLDGEQAKAQRLRLFDKVATDKILIAGSHLDFPALAHLERAGPAYAFVPEVWRGTP